MLAFVVLSGHGPARIARLAAAAEHSGPSALGFEAGERFSWRSAAGNIAMLGWGLHAEGYPVGARWAADERGVTAFSGYAFPGGSPWQAGSWAAQLRAIAEERGIEGLHRCWGSYAVAHLSTDGSGFVAADPLSLALLYVAEHAGVVAVSNHPTLAAVALDEPALAARSAEGVGWLLAHDTIPDDSTSYERVRTLAARRAVRVSGATVAEVDTAPQRWTLQPRPYPEVLADLESELRSHVAVAAGAARRPQLNLTGGRDSRLVLALAVAEGCATRFKASTMESYPGLRDADVEVAAGLAGEFGLDHVVRQGSRRHWSSDELATAIANHVFLCAGMLPAHNVRKRLQASARVQVGGGCGELYTGFRGHGAAATVEAFVRSRVTGSDEGGLLRPDVAEHYRRRMAEILAPMADAGDGPADLAYRFYVEHRAHGWMGRGDIGGIAPGIQPLYSPLAVEAARALGPEARTGFRVHLDLILRCCPRLAALPLAGEGWPPALLAATPGGERYAAAPVVGERGPRTMRGLRWEAHVELLRALLLDDPQNPARELIDAERVDDLLSRRAPVLPAQNKQLFVAAGVAAWLGGHDRPDRVGPGDVDGARVGPDAA